MSWTRQLTRFGLVGLAANALGIAIFALLIWAGLSAAMAVLVVYPFAVIVAYCGNKQLTFEHRGQWWATVQRYLLMQLGGLLINLGMQWLIAGRYGVHAVLVQAMAVVVVAAYGFLVMRYYVFAPRGPMEGKVI